MTSEETPEERAARHALNGPLIEAFDAIREAGHSGMRVDAYPDGKMIVILQPAAAKDLMAVLGSNSDHPTLDDLLSAMNNPRHVKTRR